MLFIAQNLRFLRKKLGLSQQALAEKIGLNRGNIASYEKGSAEPSAQNLLKVSTFFKVDLVDFIDKNLAEAENQDAEGGESLSNEGAAGQMLGKEHLKQFVRGLGSKENVLNSIEALAQRSMDMGKIIEGFKQFHELRINRIDEVSKPMQILLVDYERLIDVSEEILAINREIVVILAKDRLED